jgi:spore coat polysaccharide biosynthesis protein SpsF
MNLKAIKLLYPHQQLYGIEINTKAANMLSEVIPQENVYHSSIIEFEPQQKWDLVLIKGVLIHINPDELNNVYDKLVTSSSRYLLVSEYYSLEPVSIDYRGHSERLFKRDFAVDIMDRHPKMELVDYGFVYRWDPNFPQDDINWFLMEKRS